MSADPIKSGANWFTYCSCNPPNAIDVTGKKTLGELLTAAAINLGAATRKVNLCF